MSGCSEAKVNTIVIADREVVFSEGSTSTPAFHPFSPDAMEGIGAKLDACRMTVQVETRTPNGRVRGAFRTSEDGVAWSGPTSITTYVDNNGSLTGNWTGTPNDWKRFVQFGAEVVNLSGTAYEQLRVTLTLDLRLQS